MPHDEIMSIRLLSVTLAISVDTEGSQIIIQLFNIMEEPRRDSKEWPIREDSRLTTRVAKSDLHCKDLGQYESVVTTITRLLVKFFSAACCIRTSFASHRRTVSEDGLDDGSPRTYLKKSYTLKFIKNFVLLVYMYTAIRFSVLLFYQYKYDISSTRLNQLDMSLSHDARDIEHVKKKKLNFDPDFLRMINVTEFRNSLEEDKQQYERILKSIGCPYMHEAFVAEVLYLIVMTLTMLTYSIPIPWIRGLNLYFFGMLLEKPEQLNRCRKLIEAEVTAIRNSSRTFVLTHASLCAMDRHSRKESLRRMKSSSGIRKQARDHANTVRILDNWLKEDILIPVNYSSEWIYDMCKTFTQVSATQLSVSVVQDFLVFYWFHMIFDQHLELDPLDIFALIELILHAMIDVIATSYYLCMFNAIATNQMRYINWLKIEMDAHCKLLHEINEHLYTLLETRRDELLESKKCGLIDILDADSIDSMIKERMNETLLLAILQYKIFGAQFAPLRTLLGLCASFQIMMSFFVPFVIRVHVPYVAEKLQEVVGYFPITVLIMCDIVLVAICRIHQVGIEMGRRIWSLQAASMDLNARFRSLRLQPAYYEHSLQLYDKETRDTLKFASQFTVITFFGPLTYPNLVQMHYWFCLVFISAFCEVESWIKLLGRRFYDPLGIYIDP